MYLWKYDKKGCFLEIMWLINLVPLVREMEMDMEKSEIVGYEPLVNDLKLLINKKQYHVLKMINAETINLYWEIGEEIYKQQEQNGWGKSIVQVLSKELQKEFPGAKGYSAANLWRMRNFYLTYRDSEKLAPLVREISWSNNIIIMEKCKDDLQREFYIQMTKRYGWTKRVLTNFIEAQTYEKYLLNQTNFDLTLTEERRVQAKLAVKDEYTFDFAELSPEYSEHELEMQLVNNIRSFLIEMGGDFTFIGNQYHLMIGSRDLYIDLLLFHRRLRSLIAIELKIGEFEAEYAGKMQMYLTALDEQVKLPDENPSIGIIICKSKDKMYVEYALKQINDLYDLYYELPEEQQQEVLDSYLLWTIPIGTEITEDIVGVKCDSFFDMLSVNARLFEVVRYKHEYSTIVFHDGYIQFLAKALKGVCEELNIDRE